MFNNLPALPALLLVTAGLVIGVPASGTAQSQSPGSDAATSPAAAEDNPIVATVGGYRVRLSDLDRRWHDQDPGSFAHFQQEQYEARRRALDSIIGAYLLDGEAKRRGTTVERLLEDELPKRMPVPTGAQILEAYTASGAAANGIALDEVRQSLAEGLATQQNRGTALARYIDELRRAAHDVTVAFDAPRRPIVVLPTDRALGSQDAAVTLVEFGDFQCPFCRATTTVLKRLLAEHKDRVRLVWKDSPLQGHPDARPAAEAARCAAEQGRFWDYHDKLFANQKALSKGRLKEYAKQMKLDQSRFEACFNGGAHAKAVQLALDEAATLGVTATPTIFINGRMVVGALPYEAYEQIIQEELDRTRVR